VTTDSVTRALNFLRHAILAGSMTPGEKVNQNHMAELIGISRIPLREALGILATEGILSYELNRGYTVPKLRLKDAKQIYRMRQLLEDDLIRQIAKPTSEDLIRLHNLNDSMVLAIKQPDLGAFVRLNREFHFALFEMSKADLIIAEVDRLWAKSDGYRAIYLYEPQTAERATLDHERIIDAVSSGDTELTVRLLHEHRAGAEKYVCRLLAIREQSEPPGHSLATVGA
jgi:DNA-binding GntR family transcriptional regulator